MIERLLTADAALERGDPDTAARLYRQVAEADPRNAIAVVGLARVAEARGDMTAARTLAAQALSIDPDEAAAHRLLEAPAAEPSVLPAAVAPADRPAPPGRRGFWAAVRRLFRRA